MLGGGGCGPCCARCRACGYATRSTVASALWCYGEDPLANRLLATSDRELRDVQTIAAHYEDPSFPLPVSAKRITHAHVVALAAITYFEGRVRPLARARSRPIADRPERFTPVAPDPRAGISSGQVRQHDALDL